MIWSDRDIASNTGVIITPFEDLSVQPASYDVRLGNVFLRYPKRPWWKQVWLGPTRCTVTMPPAMDRIEANVIDLPPGGFLLGVTQERISLGSDVVGRVEGKSSLGRLGLSIHSTAGFIDPGFTGYVTLEMSNQSPNIIQLFAGMYIAQIAFENTKSVCLKPYGWLRASRYTDQFYPEPVASRAHLKP